MMAGAGRTAPLRYCCVVPLPGRRTVRSRPKWSRRIRTRIAHGIVTATRGCSWNPLATGPSSEVSGVRAEPRIRPHLLAAISQARETAVRADEESRSPGRALLPVSCLQVRESQTIPIGPVNSDLDTPLTLLREPLGHDTSLAPSPFTQSTQPLRAPDTEHLVFVAPEYLLRMSIPC